MAMKALRCPQCGADLELDDSKEFGFCSSCGTKIMLHETVEMKHTGAVSMKMDNSDQGRNRITLGNRAFDAGNYEEAYEYFTKGLEDVPDDITCIIRKGICAVYLSPLDNLRIAELGTSLDAAHELWIKRDEALDPEEGKDESAKNELGRLAEQEETDLLAMLDAIEDQQEYYYQLSNIEKCHAQAARWCEMARLYAAAYTGVVSPAGREVTLEDGIAFCDRVLGYDVKYYTHTTTDKKGNETDHFSRYSMESGRAQVIREIRTEMADAYNNLPSRLAQAEELSSDLSALEEEAGKLAELRDEAQAKYDAAKAAFWENNPELTARRDKNNKLSWISVGVGALAFLITFLAKGDSMVMPIVGGLVFVASFFLRGKIAKSSLAKLEKEVFPADVKALGEALDEAKTNWFEKESARRSKQGEVAAFEASKK